MVKAAQDLGLSDSSALTVCASNQIQVPALGDTSHCQRPLWPVQVNYKASISGSVRLRNTLARSYGILTNRPVPKHVWLRFVVETNVPQPYGVKWQVVNTGQEASNAEELRGDFYEGNRALAACVGNPQVMLERTGLRHSLLKTALALPGRDGNRSKFGSLIPD